MAIGIRPMIPARENRQARGMAKISAYGARKPGGRAGPGPGARCAPAIACLSPCRISEERTEPEDTRGGNQFPVAGVPPAAPVPRAADHRTPRPWLDEVMPAYDAFL